VWATFNKMSFYTLEPVGFIRSTLKRREDALRQGPEGAPYAWLETGSPVCSTDRLQPGTFSDD